MVAGRKVEKEREREGGGNSPAHLLSFSARFYPAEFLWQPLKKWCAVNCGFEMRRLIAPRGGDGWLSSAGEEIGGGLDWDKKNPNPYALGDVCASVWRYAHCAHTRVRKESLHLIPVRPPPPPSPSQPTPRSAACQSWHPPGCTGLCE